MSIYVQNQFSAFTSDLNRNPDLREAIEHECGKHGDFVRVTQHGKVTTFEAAVYE